MARDRLIFNAFTMNVPSHIYHGLWRRPDTTQAHFNDLKTWTDLCRTLERGKFDGIFFADILGIDPAFGGEWDAYIEEGMHFPCHDAAALCGALIGVTENLGLTFTSSIVSEHPFSFARKMATWDHLSNGRIGWNIVTGATHNAAQNFGYDQLVEHDKRYQWAEEYMQVVYKLLEGSWDDDAILIDRENGIYADKNKVHRIYHQGDWYKVLGPHIVSPSPQRVPLLYQAGASKVGREFAARHAEETIAIYPTVEGARADIPSMREMAVAAGRKASDIKIMQGFSFVVGSTEEEAWAKSAEIDQWVSYRGLASHVSRDMGIDLADYDPEQPIEQTDISGVQGYARMFEASNPGKKARVEDIVKALSYASRMVGTPESIADQLEEWQDAGIDGVNMICQFFPQSYEDFVDHVVPVLQERGLMQREYAPGSLREKVFPGSGGRLPETHPAAAYRGSFKDVAARSSSGTAAGWDRAPVPAAGS